MVVRIHYAPSIPEQGWRAPPEVISACSLVERVPMWVLYEAPGDFPEGWVARLWYSVPAAEPTLFAIAADSRYEVEKAIPGLREGRWVWLPRSVNDDPNIAGVWY